MTDTPQQRSIDTFICYRRDPATDHIVRWLYESLEGYNYVDSNGQACIVDVYFDQATPTLEDWQRFNHKALESAKAFVIVITQGIARDFSEEGNDYVYDEINYWFEEKGEVLPIVVNTTDGGDKWFPRILKQKYPKLNWIALDPRLIASGQPRYKEELEDIVERVRSSVRVSENHAFQHELNAYRLLTVKATRRMYQAIAATVVAILLGILALVVNDHRLDLVRADYYEAKADLTSVPNRKLELLQRSQDANWTEERQVKFSLLKATHIFSTLIDSGQVANQVALHPDGRHIYLVDPVGAGFEAKLLTLDDDLKRSVLPSKIGNALLGLTLTRDGSVAMGWGSEDRFLHRWSAYDTLPRIRFPSTIELLASSAEGTFVAVKTEGDDRILMRRTDGTGTEKTLSVGIGVIDIEFLKGDTTVLIAWRDSIWVTDLEFNNVETRQTSDLSQVSLSSDGDLIAMCHRERIQLEYSTGRVYGEIQGAARGLVFDENHGLLGVLRHDGNADLYRLVDLQEIGTLVPDDARIRDMAFNTNKNSVITVDDVGRIQEWKLPPVTPVWDTTSSAAIAATAVYLHSSEPIALAAFDGTGYLKWGLPGKSPEFLARPASTVNRPYRMASLDNVILEGDRKGNVGLWFGGDYMLLTKLDNAVSALDIDEGNNRLLVAGQDSVIYLFKMRLGSSELIDSIRQPSVVKDACFSPDGEEILVACLNGDIRLLSSASAVTVAKARQPRVCDFIDNGNIILYNSNDTLYRCTLNGQQKLPIEIGGEYFTDLDTYHGQNNSVGALALNDGRVILLDRLGYPKATIYGRGAVSIETVSIFESWVISGSGNGNIEVWKSVD